MRFKEDVLCHVKMVKKVILGQIEVLHDMFLVV